MEVATEAQLNVILESHDTSRRRRRVREMKNARQYVERDRELGQQCLWNDYFAEQSVYIGGMFRQRFLIHRYVFMRIVERVQGIHFFVQWPDATGRVGLTPIQKCTAAIQMLAYGYADDSIDEYVRIEASTARECLYHFLEVVISTFGEEYLRMLNQKDIRRLLAIAEGRGFPGMLGSIDYIHWEWKNCPIV